MICTICHGMLCEYKGREWRGSFDLSFIHHTQKQELQRSAEQDCCICRVIWANLIQLSESKQDDDASSTQISKDPLTWYIRASLSFVRVSGFYRLEFVFRDSDKVGAFVLLPKDREGDVPLDVAISDNTSSEQVLELAKQWIDRCQSHAKCRIESDTRWYPTRLLDLNYASEGLVRLVITKEASISGPYMTLSHCWGLATAPFIPLTQENMPSFLLQGIPIKNLPKNFQDAIDFTCRLGQRYLWIDCFCIIQEDKQDWLSESTQMGNVYANSYCNLSATAASDNTKGLYYRRKARQVWVDEIDLKTDDMPGNRLNSPRCTILDLSFWNQMVDDAPVNRRSWVLQERLLAPRVLHFCQDQIAWECRELDAAECRPAGLPHLQLRRYAVVDGSRLKGLDPLIDGRHLREGRLGSMKISDPDANLSDIYTYELWSRAVEVYSKTLLTNAADKLIAFSGIAKMMSEKLHDQYVAGLWAKYLASQLLWYVNPSILHKTQYLFPASRPPIYRAPSFSWAAIDSRSGITYGETTDKSLFIKVKEYSLEYLTDDKFGLVTGGYVKLVGMLKKVELEDSKRDVSTRYSWQLVTDNRAYGKKFHNVALDSPSSDQNIFGPEGRMYCLVAARGVRTRFLICLLLQQLEESETGTFRRIGWTKISQYDQDSQLVIIEPSGEEARMPCLSWDSEAGENGEHTIVVV